jgi:hypothetical protein
LYWLQLILAGTGWALITFTVPDTYLPVILNRAAAKLRKETGDPTCVSTLQLHTESTAHDIGSFSFDLSNSSLPSPLSS